MLNKAIVIVVTLAACWQLSQAAPPKFESHQEIVRYSAFEFVKTTFPSIQKGIELTDDIIKDLKALDTKTEADKKSLEKLEAYYEEASKSKDATVTQENFKEKAELALQSLFLIGNYKTKESFYIMNSPAVKELFKKYNFESIRESFFNDFKKFSDEFVKTLDDFLTYAKEENIADLGVWAKKFKEENDPVQKLHLYLSLWVNIGQFGD